MLRPRLVAFLICSLGSTTWAADCSYDPSNVQGPLSQGKYQLSYQRPAPACRTLNITVVEETIQQLNATIADPDLFRLFENAFPNTLDTTVSWKGFASGNVDEELSFIVTGDITAMWLRDSANQLRSYKSLLTASTSTHSLASLFRGAINLQARYVRTSPHCNAFQPPDESGLPPQDNDAGSDDKVTPAYSSDNVFECKYELDSLAAFLQLSYDYYDKTNDTAFFGKFGWVKAVETVLNTTEALLVSTYSDNGHVNKQPYTFQRTTATASDTLLNNGQGSPVNGSTGLVRSAFRPSDDATIYELFIPANMMFSVYLGRCAEIMKAQDSGLAGRMSSLAASVRAGVEAHGKVHHAAFGEIYAYEIDGYGSRNMMDDANVPSLLSIPVLEYLSANDSVYQATRKFVLSTFNPYYMHGKVINGVGGPHNGPGYAWPMSIIVSLLSSDDDTEILAGLKTLVSSTAQLGLIHESINTFNASDYTRSWFAWANGLFGEMILDLSHKKPHLLKTNFQS